MDNFQIFVEMKNAPIGPKTKSFLVIELGDRSCPFKFNNLIDAI